MNSGKSWLCAELMRTKSGYSDWAVNPKTIWPQWSWERLGALAMTSDPKGDKKRSLDELWRLLQKAKRHREARYRLTQEHVDYLMKRRMGEWYKSLRMLRSYGAVRAD